MGGSEGHLTSNFYSTQSGQVLEQEYTIDCEVHRLGIDQGVLRGTFFCQ